ncbi:hypothetical protein LXA43DRAFT_1103486 [Ganoderma leucocontextum]|nr:hypothetical protein LXA43DRAFT_1103486 [Ganoderma leucocontextum]
MSSSYLFDGGDVRAPPLPILPCIPIETHLSRGNESNKRCWNGEDCELYACVRQVLIHVLAHIEWHADALEDCSLTMLYCTVKSLEILPSRPRPADTSRLTDALTTKIVYLRRFFHHRLAAIRDVLLQSPASNPTIPRCTGDERDHAPRCSPLPA